MHEMRIEHPGGDTSVELWHVVPPADAVALCGAILTIGVTGTGRPPGPPAEGATERYCADCLAAFSEKVAAGAS
jgi:hypothetical protein